MPDEAQSPCSDPSVAHTGSSRTCMRCRRVPSVERSSCRLPFAKTTLRAAVNRSLPNALPPMACRPLCR